MISQSRSAAIDHLHAEVSAHDPATIVRADGTPVECVETRPISAIVTSFFISSASMSRRDLECQTRKAVRRSFDCAVDRDPTSASGFPARNGASDCRKRAQGEQQVLAAERSPILSTLGDGPIDQDAVRSNDPFCRRGSDLLNPYFQRLTHSGSCYTACSPVRIR
jgi:hypothetical protein